MTYPYLQAQALAAALKIQPEQHDTDQSFKQAIVELKKWVDPATNPVCLAA